MRFKTLIFVVSCLFVSVYSQVSHANGDGRCQDEPHPAISFIEFPSTDALSGEELTIKGRLDIPVEWQARKRCFVPQKNVAAVVILHGSAGVDSRGNFYARALNAAGIATLEIDMWEARGVTGISNRPLLPLATYPDAFGALAFLSTYPGIDPERIGVMGFSWGGVVTMASATQNVATVFGGALRFKAHVANYPICYAYNNPYIPNSAFGANATAANGGPNPLTGARLMIQIGKKDDYDRANDNGDGSLPCRALKTSPSLTPAEQGLVNVVTYEGAYHAWDRLMVPVSDKDPFGHLGEYLLDPSLPIPTIEVKPSVAQAYESRERVVKFFLRNL